MPGPGRRFTSANAKQLGRPFTKETASAASKKRKRRYIHHHDHAAAVACGKMNTKTTFTSDTARVAAKKVNDRSRYRSKENCERRALVAYVYRHIRRTRLNRIKV